MLTTKERIWLKNREKKVEYCKWCPQEGTLDCPKEGIYYPITECPTYKLSCDWIDATEFEARVAVLLAQKNTITFPCDPKHCYVPEPCSWCRLKAARLAVEEEMDG